MKGSGRYTEYGKTIPRFLVLIGPIVLVLATYYFIRVFFYFDKAFDYFSAQNTFLYLVYLLVLFVLYLNFLLTAYWLTSGNRRSWARMMRLSIVFIVMTAINEHGFRSVNSDGSALVLLIITIALLAMMAFMMSRPVRDFYTPAYAHPLPLREWIPYIVWVDPYHCNAVEME